VGCSWACVEIGHVNVMCLLEVERGRGGWMSGGKGEGGRGKRADGGEGRDRTCANLRFEYHII
jgi:hypothetical protein